MNTESFPDIANAVKDIQKGNQHIIFGNSYALANSNDYSLLKEAMDKKCIVNSSVLMYMNKPLIGYLDNTEVCYIDPFSDGITTFL